MESELLHPFVMEEVLSALKGMNSTKTPSPNGLSALFFQKYWSIVGFEFFDLVL